VAVFDSRPDCSSAAPGTANYDGMARRRFQDPTPFVEGAWWWILYRQDEFISNEMVRKLKRVKLAPATTKEREVKKIAAEHLRPMNQGLESIGAGTQFKAYVEGIYREAVEPLLASSTRSAYSYHMAKYVMPVFHGSSLRDMSTMTLQRFFSGLKGSRPTAMKIKDTLGSVFSSAIRFQLLVRNPLQGVQFPPDRQGKRSKPCLTPEQFNRLVTLIGEPYATMVYACVFAGLRVSELVGLRWEDVHPASLTIDERYCRGDWSCPKTALSAATIGVDRRVIERIHALKGLQVTINWGAKGKRTLNAVRADGPKDLVFQPLCGGKVMDDHNILARHIKPAGAKLGIPWVNWQVLRRSYGTWMVESGADPKAVQAQMRHSRISTTMDIYAQFVPDAQKRAVQGMMDMVDSRMPAVEPASERMQ
jgi:integrase